MTKMKKAAVNVITSWKNTSDLTGSIFPPLLSVKMGVGKAARFLLAAAMALSMSVPAFAEDYDINPGSNVKPLVVNEQNYYFVPCSVLFVTDENGKALMINDDGSAKKPGASEPVGKGSPEYYIAKFDKLKFIGTDETLGTGIDSVAERSFYSDGGDELLAVWKFTQIDSLIIGEQLAENYGKDHIFESIVYAPNYNWVYENDKMYYRDPNGVNATGWYCINGELRYFRKNGEMATKNTTIGGVRYKFDTGGMYEGKFTGMTKSAAGKRYWKNGKLVKNKTFTVKGKRYRADKNGYVTLI